MMSRRLSLPILALPVAAAITLWATPLAAQFQSQGYKFLQAVRDAKNDEVIKILDQPGQSIVNARDVSNGEGALHIVIKRGDSVYLRYLLSKGADPNLRDGKGNTPLLLAVQYGQNAMVDSLTAQKASVNLANASGETPLIRAVQKRDIALVRALLAAGADPDQADVIAGQSARDYARADTRTPAIAKMIDETPKSARRAVSGPKL